MRTTFYSLHEGFHLLYTAQFASPGISIQVKKTHLMSQLWLFSAHSSTPLHGSRGLYLIGSLEQTGHAELSVALLFPFGSELPTESLRYSIPQALSLNLTSLPKCGDRPQPAQPQTEELNCLILGFRWQSHLSIILCLPTWLLSGIKVKIPVSAFLFVCFLPGWGRDIILTEVSQATPLSDLTIIPT